MHSCIMLCCFLSSNLHSFLSCNRPKWAYNNSSICPDTVMPLVRLVHLAATSCFYHFSARISIIVFVWLRSSASFSPCS
ncbi:hypothetical protein EDB19DRAFT_1683111 [Suillus lakei]|nr:hypothetical protein EDB19DRAFT_1683111 [Suillus lakei]